MTEERHPATLRDYMLAFKRRKLLIVGITLVAALAAAALTVTQKKTYTATASLQANALSDTAGFAGIQDIVQNVPATTSAQLMQTATREAVLSRVKSELHLSGSLDDIRNKLTLSQDAQSNFVQITATSDSAVGAQRLANATADAVEKVSNSDEAVFFANVGKQVQVEAHALLAPYAGKRVGQLNAEQQAAYQSAYEEALTDQQNAGKLETFSKIVTVAQVVDPAVVPSNPSGPHPASTIIVAAVVGFLLSLLVAWFLESFDRRLRRPDESAELMGFPVVGALSTGALGKAPGSGREDASSVAAFRMLRTNVRFLAPNHADAPRAVLVTSAVSEEGKTTVAMGLALSAAESGLRTLLIEADVHRPVHAARLSLSESPGLADYLQDGLSPEQILQVHPIPDADAGPSANGSSVNGRTAKLTCITAGDVTHFNGDALGSKRFGEVIEEVKKVYDLVVIDSAPLLAVAETSELVAFVDAIVFCIRLGRTTTEHAKAARAALARLPQRLTGLVLADLEPESGGYYGYAYGYTAGEKRDKVTA